jgi:hypothetical protein
VGWGCLPRPSFVCPRCHLHSELLHPFPSTGHGCLDLSMSFPWCFVIKQVGGLGIDIGRLLSLFGLAGAH